MTEGMVPDWVDQAVKQDKFTVRTEQSNQIPSEDERHSVSVIDIFSSFNQTIDRIVQLNWDDDLQYAKFMTSLAKVVGVGIARYCEVIEQMFTREMDRLTPEQEAATNQSKQEKWLQVAKDAWNNKEKIEPFQFFPAVSFYSIQLQQVFYLLSKFFSPLSSLTISTGRRYNWTSWNTKSTWMLAPL